MGGGAFRQAVAPGHPTLNTPRMSPTEYALVKDTYTARIKTYFSDASVKVGVLKEAPEKPNYGDVDLFIGLDAQVDFVDLANAVGAAGLILHDDYKCSMAVPRDSSTYHQATTIYRTVHNDENGWPAPPNMTLEEYAQIDIDVIAPGLVDWFVFYSAYGDLNGLLGHIVTHLGFTVTDRGLWLRMSEHDAAKTIERANIADELGKIFLSNGPEQVMHFMGLSVERWCAGFASLDDLYEWLGACRMLHPVAIKLKRDKPHERNREERRNVYRKFFFEWLRQPMPDKELSYERMEQAGEIAVLRQRYLNEALDFFDKRSLYEDRYRTLVMTINNAISSNLLRPIVIKHSGAKAKKVTELMRAFRRFTEFDVHGRPHLRTTPHTDAESQLYRFLSEDAARLEDEKVANDFVRLHWEEAKGLERLRAKKMLGVEEPSHSIGEL